MLARLTRMGSKAMWVQVPPWAPELHTTGRKSPPRRLVANHLYLALGTEHFRADGLPVHVPLGDGYRAVAEGATRAKVGP